MSLRDKTRRRLLVLSAAVLGVGAVVGTAAAVRVAYLRKAAEAGRTQGLAAMASNDYPTALKQLGRYLGRYPNDADVLLPYAKARELVEESNNSNLGQAISLYQRVLELKPGLPEAQRRLLDLYLEVGFNTEAITLADAILSRAGPNPNPLIDDRVHALRGKTVALLRMQRLSDAQTNVGLLTQLLPLDLEIRVLELQIMLRKGKPQEVMDHANKLAQEHSGDSRFVLLRSIAASLTGDDKTARAVVEPLATQPQVDPPYTRLLVAQLDRVQLFNDSFACLQQAAKDSSDPDIQRLWIRRLFEDKQLQTLIDHTANVDPSSTSTDVETLAMRVLSLARSQRSKDATDIIAALEKRGSTDPRSAKWAAALRTIVQHDSANPLKSVSAIRDALLVSPNNPVLLEELGDAYAEAGSGDKAMSQWRTAANVAPEWGAPLVHISQSMVNAGRTTEALDAAKAANLRSPHDRDALSSLAVASAAMLPQGGSADTDKVLALISDITRQFPKETELWPLKVSVLAQAQRKDAAIQAIHDALACNPPPSEHSMLSLAQISQSFGLNLEAACWDASEKAYGLTPDLALARASWLRDHQQNAQALDLLEKGRAQHPPDDLYWHLAWAEYLDQSADPRARAEWIALGDANANNVRLQWRAVSARAVQNDHDFLGRTIDRLVSLIGEDSLALHMLRARWYLRGSSGDSDASKAAILLGEVSRSAPDMLAPRLLLASCYMRLGNITGAIEQLVSASDAQPELAALSIEVARVLHAHGEFTRSRQYIERACRSRQATVPIVRQAASLLALQGDYPTALSILENAYKDQKQLPADLVLASLYRQMNQPAKTEQICQRLMEKPDAPSVAFTADFYASQDHLVQAKAALALLDGMKLPPGDKDSVLARFDARYGSADDAAALFLSAARAYSNNPAAWQQLITFCFGSGRIDSAIAAAAEASQKLPNAAGFTVVTNNASLIRDAQHQDGVRPLLMALGTDAAVNTPVLAAISEVVAARNHSQPIDQIAFKLRQLADQNPHVLALQTITLEFYMDCGDIDEAARLAAKTAQAFPGAVEPVRIENVVLGNERHWPEALGAAKEWRRDAGESLDADLAVAIADVHLGDFSGANQQIQPYLDRAAQDPDKFSGVMLIRAVGLLANHKPDQAENLLSPFLAKSPRIRSIWLSLATTNLDDAARAQAWVDQAAAVVPDNPAEQSDLGLAEISVGRRWSKPDEINRGTALLAAIAARSDSPAKSLLAWGQLCEESGDWTRAQNAYQQIIARNPGGIDNANDLLQIQAIALNNQASVLLKTGGDLEQAQQMAIKALSINPKRPPFLDTLASIQAARKDFDSASSTMKLAKQLEPQNFKWRVNLLAIMADAGITDTARMLAAKSLVQETRVELPTLMNVTPQLRQKFDALSAKLQ